MKKEDLVSDCCEAPVGVDRDGIFDDAETSPYWVCTKCNSECEVLSPNQ